jgi:hypothetical protein
VVRPDIDHDVVRSAIGATAVAAAAGRGAGDGTLLLDDLVCVVAPGRRAAVTIPREAPDDIEALDLAVLEVAEAEHRARLLLSQLVHDLPFLLGLAEPVDEEGVTTCDAV